MDRLIKTPSPLHLILAVIALVAIALPALVVRYGPNPQPVVRRVPPTRIVSAAELPPVEPVLLRDIAPDAARVINADIPVVDGPNPAARPYRMAGAPDDVARATDCLAAAVWYEAGDDAVGEEAVAQVILNRLRHPAYPKSVCGVIFQGSERRTGCQFTFTCDGALRRTPGDAAWRRARDIAAAALTGTVYAPVGWATHYHTDWVVPYWSASLDKVAKVGTHLFFRWTGWWGTPRAFSRTPLTAEPMVAALASLSAVHGSGGMAIDPNGAALVATPFFGRVALPLPNDPDTFITSLNPSQQARFAAMALAACGDRDKCKFMGWTNVEQVPFTAKMTPVQMAAMSFSYLRDRTSGLERTLWNCGEFRGGDRTCMKRSAIRVPPPADRRGDRRRARPGRTDRSPAQTRAFTIAFT